MNHMLRRMLSEIGPLGLREVYATVEWRCLDGKPRGLGGLASVDAERALAFMSGADVDMASLGVDAMRDAGLAITFDDHPVMLNSLVYAVRFTAVADAVPPWTHERRGASCAIGVHMLIDYLKAKWATR